MRKSHTCSIALQADYGKVFDFLADVNNMPRWTVFAKTVRPNGDGKKFIAETPQGTAELWIEADKSRGDIVYYWQIGDLVDNAPTHLSRQNGGLLYEFSCQEPPGAPEGTLDQLTKIVDEELLKLREIAESELRS